MNQEEGVILVDTSLSMRSKEQKIMDAIDVFYSDNYAVLGGDFSGETFHLTTLLEPGENKENIDLVFGGATDIFDWINDIIEMTDKDIFIISDFVTMQSNDNINAKNNIFGISFERSHRKMEDIEFLDGYFYMG